MSISREWIASSDFTILRAPLVAALGGNAAAALVLTRILWRCEGPYAAEDGWWRANREQIAEETGLSPDQVKRLIAKLLTDGHLKESKQRADGRYDQTNSYRVVVDEMSESSQEAIPPNGSGGIAQSTGRNRPMDLAGSPNVDWAESPNDSSYRDIETLPIPSAEARPSTNGQETAKVPKVAGKRVAAPASFAVTPSLREWAAKAGVTANLDTQTEQFLDYHRGKGSRMVDWTAAWRTWMRNSIEFGARSNGHGQLATQTRRKEW